MNKDIKSTKMEIADIQKNVERNLKEEITIFKEMEEIKFTFKNVLLQDNNLANGILQGCEAVNCHKR